MSNEPDYENNLFFSEKKEVLDEYNYEEEESGRTETLVKTIDKVEILKQQLEIAKKCLSIYAQAGHTQAKKALKDIENVQPK